MPYSLRLLENGSQRTMENGIIRALELVPETTHSKCHAFIRRHGTPGPTARASPSLMSQGPASSPT